MSDNGFTRSTAALVAKAGPWWWGALSLPFSAIGFWQFAHESRRSGWFWLFLAAVVWVLVLLVVHHETTRRLKTALKAAEAQPQPRLVFGEPYIKEGESLPGRFFAVLPVSNSADAPTPSADVEHARAVVSFYAAKQEKHYQDLNPPPFEARWSSNPWPRGGPLPGQETTLRSTGHPEAVDLVVMQKHSAAHWWNDETANDLFNSGRILPLDDYFIHVKVIGHDAKAEQWLRFQREPGKQLPVVSLCDKPEWA